MATLLTLYEPLNSLLLFHKAVHFLVSGSLPTDMFNQLPTETSKGTL